MPISVNAETCIGCGACVSVCPGSFRMNDAGKSEPTAQEKSDCTVSAAETCPVQAITVE